MTVKAYYCPHYEKFGNKGSVCVRNLPKQAEVGQELAFKFRFLYNNV